MKEKWPAAYPLRWASGWAAKSSRIAVEGLDVGNRIRTRRPPDRRLVDQNDIVQPLCSLELAVKVRGVSALILTQGVRHRGVKHVMHQGGLAGAGNTRDADQHAHGNLDIEPGQVVNPRTPQYQLLPHRLPPPGRNGNGELPAQIAAGQRVGISLHLIHRARSQNAATQFSGAGPEIDQPVGRANHVRVVLDHQDGVAQVAQFLEDANQLRRIPAVQSDGRFVQHVERSHQAGAERSRQLDALRFSSRKGWKQAGRG